MDREPKTRQETKGRKGKEGKGIYNQKAIRIREELIEKNKNSRKNDNRSVADAPKKNNGYSCYGYNNGYSNCYG